MRNKLEFLTNRMGHRWEKFDAKELTHHTWDVFRAQKTPTWFWDKFNADTKQKFIWNKYAVKEDTQYSWKRHERVDTVLRTDHYWDKHNVQLTDQYPSWEKEELDSDPIHVWNKFEKVVDEDRTGIKPVELDYDYTEGGISQLRAAYLPGSGSSMKPNSVMPMSGSYNFENRCEHAWSGYKWKELTNDWNQWASNERGQGRNTWLFWPIKCIVCGDINFGYNAATAGASFSRIDAVYNTLDDGRMYFSGFRSPTNDPTIEWGPGKYSPPYPLQAHNSSSSSASQKTATIPRMNVGKFTKSGPYIDGVMFAVNSAFYKRIDGTLISDYDRSEWNRVPIDGGSYTTITYYKDSSAELNEAIDYVLGLGYKQAYVLFYVADHDSYGNGTQDAALGMGSVQCFRVSQSGCILTSACGDPPSWAHYKDTSGETYGSGGTGDLHYYYQFECPQGADVLLHVDGPGVDIKNPSGYIPVSSSYTDGTIGVMKPDKSGKFNYQLGGIVATAPITVNNNTLRLKEISEKLTRPLSYDWGNTVPDGYFGTRADGLGRIQSILYDLGTNYKRGSFLGEVRDKDRNMYPDDWYKDDYWYGYEREQITVRYGISCVYEQNILDNHEVVGILSRPVLNRDNGLWNINLGESNQYFMIADDDKNNCVRWIEVLPNGDGLYWTSVFNDGSNPYEYGNYIGAQYQDSQYYQQLDIVLNIVHSAGTYIETLTTETPDSYPMDGEMDGYWYIFKKDVPIIETSKGNYIDDIGYLNQLFYPMDGPQDGYWYVYIGKTPIYSRGQLEGQVSDFVSNAYPADGRLNGQWYTYDHSEYTQTKGNFIETISSTLGVDSYPEDGVQGYYWYTAKDYKVVTTKEEYVGAEDSTDKDAFPNDAAAGGYWYVHTGEYTRTDPTLYIEDVWSDSAGAYPTDGVSGNFWYKYVGQRYIPLYIIGDKDLKGGVKYKQDVNTSDDYIPGDVGCAEIQFTIFTEPKEAQKYLDLECDYLYRMNDTDGWTRVGHFTVTYASDKTATTTKLKAYDNIIKTEKMADDLINDKSLWPMRLDTLFTKLCQYCGLTPKWGTTAINADFLVPNNFTTSNITVRQILALVAEVAAGFVKAEEDGSIIINGYTTKHNLFSKRQYKDLTQAIYQTQDITKINIAGSTDDLGVSYGTGDVLYRIIDNPLLYIQDEHEIDKQMQNIFAVVSQVRYTPTEMTIYDPGDVQCGDIITVDGERAYVMSREWDGSKVKIVSKGQRERTVEENPIDGSIDALRGKTNELKRTIDETNSRITDVEAGLRSEIKQTASEIRATITSTKEGLESQIRQTARDLTASIKDTKEGLESKLQLTANSLTASINDTKNELEGKLSLTASQFQTTIADTKAELQSSITQTKDSIVSQITQQGQVVTEISQRLDGIKLVYNSTNGTASITIGDITVSNLVNGQYVQQQVAGIDMTGYVRFNDLSRKGSTVINGSNITTGTIDADRINLRGSISFSDLTSSLQNQITGGSGGGGGTDPVTGLPSYIKSTYIDATLIYTPTIIGGKIIARDGADGYTEMTSSGLNIHSSAYGRAIIGLGYLSNHYHEPYITLGQGVDSYGTDTGLIKKYASGIWIGDTDDISGTGSSPAAGTGIFVNFAQNRIYKYINGVATAL